MSGVEVADKEVSVATGAMQQEVNNGQSNMDSQLAQVLSSIKRLEDKVTSNINKHSELDRDIHGNEGICDEIEGLKVAVSEVTDEGAQSKSTANNDKNCLF